MTERISDTEIEEAWSRARPISGRNPTLYRIAPDVIQSVIRRDRYDIRGEFGWRIECGRPVAYREASMESAIRALEFENLQASERHIAARTTGHSRK